MAEVQVKWTFPGAKEAKEAIDAINGSVKKTGEEAKKSSGEMGSAIDANLVSLAKWAAGFATVAAATDFIKDSIAEAREAEKATAALAAQVERAGVPWKIYGEQIQEAIDGAAKYAAVQDDDVSKALQKMIFMTDDVKASVENLTLVTDLATASNISLEQAAELVAKAIEGDIESLARYLPQAKDLSKSLGSNASEATKAAAGLDLIQKAAGGANEKMTESERKSREYDKAIADLKKTVGDVFLPIIPPLNNALKEVTESMTAHIIRVNEAEGAWKKLIAVIPDRHPLSLLVKEIDLLSQGFINFSTGVDLSAKSVDRLSTVGLPLLASHAKTGAQNTEDLVKAMDALPGSARKAAEAAAKLNEEWQKFLGREDVFQSTAKLSADIVTNFKTIEHVDLEEATRGFRRLNVEVGGVNTLTEEQIKAVAKLNIESGKAAGQMTKEQRDAADEIKRQWERAAEQFERTWDAVALDVGRAVSGVFVYGDNFKNNFENLGKHFLDVMLAKSVAWVASSIAESVGLKTAMQEIFAVPIIQPVVPVSTPTGGGGASTAGTGAAATGTAGLGPVAVGLGIAQVAVSTGNPEAEGVLGLGGTPLKNEEVTKAVIAMFETGQAKTFQEAQAILIADSPALASTNWEDVREDIKDAFYFGRDTHGHRGRDFGSQRRFEEHMAANYGLAKGGIVTEEGWFNVGEMGKKEAVIPLENPQAMQMLNQAGIGGGGVEVHNHFHLSNVVMDDITWARASRRMIEQVKRELKRLPNG